MGVKRGGPKGYCTVDSRVVAHPSTNTAWRSLTSLAVYFEQPRVHTGACPQGSYRSFLRFSTTLSLRGRTPSDTEVPPGECRIRPYSETKSLPWRPIQAHATNFLRDISMDACTAVYR